MSLTAIIALLLTYLVLLLIKATDEIASALESNPVHYPRRSHMSLARVFFIYYPMKQVESVSSSHDDSVDTVL